MTEIPEVKIIKGTTTPRLGAPNKGGKKGGGGKKGSSKSSYVPVSIDSPEGTTGP